MIGQERPLCRENWDSPPVNGYNPCKDNRPGGAFQPCGTPCHFREGDSLPRPNTVQTAGSSQPSFLESFVQIDTLELRSRDGA